MIHLYIIFYVIHYISLMSVYGHTVLSSKILYNNVGKTKYKPSPSHHHGYMGGMVTIPSHGWFMIVLTTSQYGWLLIYHRFTSEYSPLLHSNLCPKPSPSRCHGAAGASLVPQHCGSQAVWQWVFPGDREVLKTMGVTDDMDFMAFNGV